MAWLLVVLALPFTVGMVGWMGHRLVNPSLVSLGFWESVAMVAVVVGRLAVVPLLAWRERRLRLRGVLR
jgi:hypothetical protein